MEFPKEGAGAEVRARPLCDGASSNLVPASFPSFSFAKSGSVAERVPLRFGSTDRTRLLGEQVRLCEMGIT